MKFANDPHGDVSFLQCDRAFLKKFGLADAREMALDFHAAHPELPFLSDALQLSDFLGVSHGELEALAHNADQLYHAVSIPKRIGGGFRHLEVPDPRLRALQRRILNRLLSRLPVSSNATAYRAGCSTRDNAAPHIGRRCLLKLDVKDFFDSIHFGLVLRTVFHTGRFSKEVGYLLTTLCCKDERLPQGAPTSPALSNLVMAQFDRNLSAWCAARRITYTRYCDDLTFSADAPLFAVYEKVKGMLKEMGLCLNESKTRFFTAASQMNVTGLVVNEKLSVPRAYKRALRQEVYYVLKFGPASALARCRDFIPLPKKEGPAAVSYLHHLCGKLRYVLFIEPQNVTFWEMLAQLEEMHPQADNSFLMIFPSLP